MGKLDNQRAVFQFLLEHYRSQALFTKNDLEHKTNWQGTSFPTYWSKQYKTLVIPVDKNQYRVSESFRPFSTWDSFRNLVTQVRRASSEYTSLTYNDLIIYEFFMPLTNEGHLRTALDALFYKNTIMSRLKTLDKKKLHKLIPKEQNEPDSDYMERVCEWVSDRFGGYSISHVSGRFRAAPLATMKDAATIQQDGSRYLIDETTAVVRFIFPCGVPIKRSPPLSSRHFEDEEVENADKEPQDAKAIRWLFGALFVQSIIQVVNGEDEIWMVESGRRNRLHIWRVQS